VTAGPAYGFPEALPFTAGVTRITRADLDLLQRMAPDLEATAREFESREPILAVLEEGSAVSLCFSSRLTGLAAEAGVETLEGYRGRGYASAAVAAWARTVRASGRVPLYSTSWENLASQAVARRLGLNQYATDLSIK
jgi:GNAT superfamily N-acetyltransferase